ncbi:MAG: ATP-binding protein [Patescibacteria group bacterium]|nr:ATP-binding protein [Patescibacteria group bacterium]
MHLNDQVKIKIMAKSEVNLKSSFENEILFESIKGHSLAKRACEIAVAGFDNLLLKSPPGVGKTLLSKALASIMPPLEREEIIEVIKIYSVDGLLKDSFYITKRPFRAPHHTTSRIGWWAVAQIPPRERYPWPSEEFCF